MCINFYSSLTHSPCKTEVLDVIIMISPIRAFHMRITSTTYKYIRWKIAFYSLYYTNDVISLPFMPETL